MSGSFHRINLDRKQLTSVSNGKAEATRDLSDKDTADLMTPPDVVECAVFSPKPDHEWVLDTDTLDMALAWHLSGVEVILEIGFVHRDHIPLDQLLAICGGSGFSISLALPASVDKETACIWLDWICRAAEVLTLSPQPCFVYPVSQYLEWLILNEIEPQKTDTVTMPIHPYGRWVANAITEIDLANLFKINVAETMDQCLGEGWVTAINRQIAQAVFHQPVRA